MKCADEIKALRAEIDALRTEVDTLKEFVKIIYGMMSDDEEYDAVPGDFTNGMGRFNT